MIGWLILAAVLALCAVLCIRAARFKPEAGAGAAPTPVAVDTEGAVQRLAQLVRIPTVSNYDAEKFDETQFEGFREKLRELYPRVHEMCPPVRIAHTGMLFHWKGKSSAAPVVLMAHYDVVPVDEAGWKHPPFCGEVFDGELWGRGTLDTKITLLGILEAAERLMSEGFVPRNDVYFSFSGDEEVSGPSAPAIVEYLKERGVRPAMVVDEGGAVVDGVFPGVKQPIAVVGIGEKGFMNVELTARAAGGHASTPAVPSTLGMLCRAVGRLRKTPVQGASDGARARAVPKRGAVCAFRPAAGICESVAVWASAAASGGQAGRRAGRDDAHHHGVHHGAGFQADQRAAHRGVGGRQPAACQSGYAGKCGAAPERRHPQR